MRTRLPLLGLLAATVLLAGCGQQAKRDEQLKAQLTAVQKENAALKGETASLRAGTEALKKQVEELTREKQALEERLQTAEARAAAKPGTKPPLRSRRAS